MYGTVYTRRLHARYNFGSVANTLAILAAQEHSALCPSATPEENELPTDPSGSILTMSINI